MRPYLLLSIVFLISCRETPQTSATESISTSPQFSMDANLVDDYASKGPLGVLPRLTATFPTVTMNQAYDLQAAWVKKKLGSSNGIGGIKGGVVTPGAMETFVVTEPICGILPASGRIAYVDGFSYQVECPGTKLETEIGFVLKEDIVGPLDNLDDFRKMLAGVCPIIEIPCGQWDAPSGTPDPRDFAAINLTAMDYVVGPLSPISDNEITYEFSKDGEVLHTASSTTNWKGPLQTAMHLANFGLRQGVKLTKGMTIICGALGAVHDANPGEYHLRAEGLADLHFTIPE